MIKIFHNSRCSKSRCALGYLEDEKIDFETVEYLKEAPGIETIRDLVKKLGIPAAEVIRKNEKIYKENYKDKSLSEEGWIQAMHEHPILIERPIIIRGDHAIIARPPEKVFEFLKGNLK